MAETITLKDLAAIIVRRGKRLLILAVVFALALGAFRMIQQLSAMNQPRNSAQEIDARYQKALEEYQLEEGRLSRELQSTQKALQEQQEYQSHSLLMKLDPYNKAVSQINLAISDWNEPVARQESNETVTADFVVSRIQNQYLVIWHSADLQAVLNSDVPDKYLREIVKVEAPGGGLLTITAYGATAEEASRLASQVHNYLVDSSSVVTESAFAHTFTLLNTSTKLMADTDLAATQKSVADTIDGYRLTISELQTELENLTPPQPETPITLVSATVSAAKYAVLGLALGMILGAAWVAVGYLFGNKLAFAAHLEQKLSVPMMTSIPAKKDIWGLWADRLAGEHIWKNEADALSYLTERAKVRLHNNETIALLTTLPDNTTQRETQLIIDTLEKSGYRVALVNTAYCSTHTPDVIAHSDCVLLAERCGCSSMAAIDTVVSLADEQQKPIKGYILI